MKYQMEDEKGIVVIKLLDERVAYPGLEEFQRLLNSKIEGGTRRLLLDLSSVKFLDSFGIGVLVGAQRKLSGLGGVLKLCGVNERIMMSLTITRLHKLLEVFDDPERALKSFETEVEEKG